MLVVRLQFTRSSPAVRTQFTQSLTQSPLSNRRFGPADSQNRQNGLLKMRWPAVQRGRRFENSTEFVVPFKICSPVLIRWPLVYCSSSRRSRCFKSPRSLSRPIARTAPLSVCSPLLSHNECGLAAICALARRHRAGRQKRTSPNSILAGLQRWW